MHSMTECIIDTNVPLVADPSTHMSEQCSATCADFIESVLSGKYRMVIDDAYILLEEYEHYRNNKNPFTYPHLFLKWILNYQSDPKYIKQVKIHRDGEYSFSEIPESLQTIDIDSSDLKFIAVSIANGNIAPIYEASDSKWIGWEKALKQEGVAIKFLCKEELLETFQKKMNNEFQ